MIKFNFIKEYDDIKNKKQNNNLSCFYQVCIYPNPHHNNTRNIRIFYIDNDNNIINYKNAYLNNTGFNEFLRNIPQNKYKLFSTYSLDAMPYPSSAEILISKSSIIN